MNDGLLPRKLDYLDAILIILECIYVDYGPKVINVSFNLMTARLAASCFIYEEETLNCEVDQQRI